VNVLMRPEVPTLRNELTPGPSTAHVVYSVV
jgi:hypothetical protein